jgi:hypothetical protein
MLNYFDRTGKRFIIGSSLLGLIGLSVFFYYTDIKPEGPKWDEQLASTVQFSWCSKQSPKIILKSGGLYRVITIGDADLDKSAKYLCEYLKPGDSVFKRSHSDTFYVFRGPAVKRWILIRRY